MFIYYNIFKKSYVWKWEIGLLVEEEDDEGKSYWSTRRCD